MMQLMRIKAKFGSEERVWLGQELVGRAEDFSARPSDEGGG